MTTRWHGIPLELLAEAARKTAAMGEPATVEEYRQDLVLKVVSEGEEFRRGWSRIDSNLGGHTNRW